MFEYPLELARCLQTYSQSGEYVIVDNTIFATPAALEAAESGLRGEIESEGKEVTEDE
ncbi:MAG: hypothetical protein N3G75_06755 [Methanothrix sp.]|nr:hypothetical protein [Methanothrix sp.]MCX8207516.1 hypothetical protein [Methanothrix sp.]